VIGPSLQADVVDWDELATGERKEGAYFAMRTFLFKTAFGVMVILTGTTLQAAGYEPGAEQSQGTRLALRSLFSLLPAACYLLAIAYVLPFFQYDGAVHARVREDLDRRAASRR
jgi:GPH family glycoside/pentoside/hexuronide:cation symporter